MRLLLIDEFLDVLDKAGKPAGQVCPRSLVHQCGYFHATAHVWVVNDANDLLLQKRSLIKETHPGLWDISCAGHLTAGDTSLDAAVREVREELGLIVDVSELRFLFSIVESYSSPDGSIEDNEFSDVYLLSIHNDRPIHFDLQEVDGIRFVTIDAFVNMVEHADPQLVPHEEEYRRIIDVVSLKSAAS